MAKIRNNKGQFISGKALSEFKKCWWNNLSIKDRGNLIKKYSENNGKPSLGKKSGLSPTWKGGRYVTKRDGYVHIYMPSHPNAIFNSKGGGGYILEHRYVMEKHIGRFLESDEDVHHINGIKNDNRICNLKLMSHSEHSKLSNRNRKKRDEILISA